MDRFKLDDPDAAEKAARLFHTTYERLAPAHGYETRAATAVPWEDVKDPNRALMIEVAGAVLDAIEQPRLPTRSEVEYRLRSALTVARDFIKHHPAVTGEWPMVVDLIDKALALGATEDPEPEVDPAQALLNLLRDARDELSNWGHGDFHYGDTPQEESVVSMVRKIDDVLASGRVQVTPQ